MAPKNVEDIFPLTPMQHLMLLHVVANPDAVTLANQVSYEIRGPLDPRLFKVAWTTLVERHPALRTAILWEDLDQPLNVVRQRVEVPFAEVDLSHRPVEVQERELLELTQRNRGERYNLGRAPLTRAVLVRLGPEEHRFVWCIHHLVADRWSYGILNAELREIYQSLAGDRPAELSEPGRFRDYVGWLARRPPGDAEAFWREHLDGIHRPTPWVPGYEPRMGRARARTVRTLDAAEVQCVEARAALWKTTPGTLILGATGLFLGRRAQATDVVVGLTVSGRPPDLARVEETVGSFVTNVPLRVTLRGEDTVAGWVRDLQRIQGARQAHEHVSLSDLHAWSELPAGEVLFDGLVVLNLISGETKGWDDLDVRPVGATLDGGYPWVLEVSRRPPELAFTLVHDAAFEDADPLMDELVDLLCRLVGAAPDAVLGDIVPLPESSGESPPTQRTGRSGESGRGAQDDTMRPFLAQELLDTWREVLGRPSIGLDDDFFDLGGTSLQAAQIFARAEGITGRALPLSTLLRSTSVRALLTAIDEPVDVRGPLISIRSGGAGPPVIVVPGIGGGVVGLNLLARALGTGRPVYGLQSRGLDGGEVPFTSIEDIADDFAAQIASLGGGAIHLMGVCWGAAVAVELARRLTTFGIPCLSLSLLDPPPLLRSDAANMANVKLTVLRERLRAYWSELRTGDWESRTQLLKDKAKAAARLLRPVGPAPELVSELNFRRVQAANTLAIERYRPRPLAGTSRIFFIEGRWMGAEDPRSEWLDLLDPRPEIVWVPGIDTGDTITTHAASIGRDLNTWFDTTER